MARLDRIPAFGERRVPRGAYFVRGRVLSLGASELQGPITRPWRHRDLDWKYGPWRPKFSHQVLMKGVVLSDQSDNRRGHSACC